ncbi:response regulator [Nitrosopumilus sp.]|uniref:response regulator n=1 Tax=Nitrosopumilus sp. TaxID=2024843 RepID=UPI00247EAB78|nr:response regulator [Nitrosopumilus sp.]MCV0431406.1 response regulator [Nitrosopumilus sp.]
MTKAIVVDDNEDIVFSLSELLEMHGIDVVGKGYNGLEAVNLFEQLHPDVVLLDLMMPEYDGLFALKKIREIDPKSTVIVITGGGPISVSDEMDALKPTKTMFKPIDINVLIETICEESDNKMPFKVQYSFKEDSNQYVCILTYDQYKNFKILPAIQECKIIKNDEENIQAYKNEMQEALNLAAKNDVSHIQKLSQVVNG